MAACGSIALYVKRVPPSRYPKIIARNLRLLRASRGWSQEFVALELEIHRSYLSGLEKGSHNPTIDQLARFEGIFGIQVIDLLNPELFMRTPWARTASDDLPDGGEPLSAEADGTSQENACEKLNPPHEFQEPDSSPHPASAEDRGEEGVLKDQVQGPPTPGTRSPRRSSWHVGYDD